MQSEALVRGGEDVALPAVSAGARNLARESVAAATRRAYEGHWRRWGAWSGGATPTDAAVADWFAVLHAAGAAPATLRQAAAALRWAWRHAPPGRRGAEWVGPIAGRVLAGAVRASRGRGRGQVAPIRWGDADLMAALAAGAQTPVGLRDAALIRVMSDALLRVSEAVALEVGDVAALGAESAGAECRIRFSKTDQEGEGAVCFLGPPTFRAVLDWRESCGLSEGPLFRSGQLLPGGVWAPRAAALSDTTVRRIIQRRAAQAGIKGRVSAHSFRRGSVQSLAAAGAGLVAIQEAGRWRDPKMPGVYARGQLAARGAVARLRYSIGSGAE